MRLVRNILLIIILMIMVPVAGCWDNRDVTAISVISGLGLDPAEGGGLEVTFRIAKPVQGTAVAGGGGSEQKSSTMITIQADTVLEAVYKANTTLSREVYLTHLQVLIINEELVRTENLHDLLDILERDREANNQTKILIAKGIKAKDVFLAQSEMEYISIDHLVYLMENSSIVGRMRDVELFDFHKQLSEGHDFTISLVQQAHDREPEHEGENEADSEGQSTLKMEDFTIEGLAVIKEGKMIGHLNSQQTWAALFVENECRGGFVNVPNPLADGKVVTVRITGSKGKKGVSIRGKRNPQTPAESLVLEVQANVLGSIGHQQGQGDLTTPEMVQILEQEAAAYIRREIIQVIEYTQQELGADIFQFGTIVHRKHPAYWREIRDWDQTYSELPLDVRVEFKLEGSGYINRPVEKR